MSDANEDYEIFPVCTAPGQNVFKITRTPSENPLLESLTKVRGDRFPEYIKATHFQSRWLPLRLARNTPIYTAKTNKSVSFESCACPNREKIGEFRGDVWTNS